MMITADFMILGASSSSVVLGQALKEANQGYLILEESYRETFSSSFDTKGTHIVFGCHITHIAVTDRPRRFILKDSSGKGYETTHLLVAQDMQSPQRLERFPEGFRPLVHPQSGEPVTNDTGESVNVDNLRFLSFSGQADPHLEAALLVVELVDDQEPDPPNIIHPQEHFLPRNIWAKDAAIRPYDWVCHWHQQETVDCTSDSLIA